MYAQLSTPVLTSPANGSVSSNHIQQTLSWNDVSGASNYLIAWDTTSSFNSPCYSTCTITSAIGAVTITGLSFGTTYYWRVKATNTNNNSTSSWSAARCFTTCSTIITTSPSNGAQDCPIRQNLYWNQIVGAAHYIISRDTTPTFNSPGCRTSTITPEVAAITISNLNFGTTYYWRVRATNNNDSDTSDWSETKHFTTISGAPTLDSPADGYVYPSTVKPLLKLNAVTGASYYLLQWSEDPTFRTYRWHLMSSSYTGLNVNGLKFGTTYYWRAYAITDNYADTSASSEVRSFTTTDAPTITAPADGTVLTNSIMPNIQWTEIVGATNYIYQCDTTPSFNSSLRRTYTLGYQSGGSNPLNLSFGKTYYLRMRATNTNESDTSAWSAVRSFTTSDSITLVSFNDPSPTANYYTRQTLSWKPYRGVTQYFLQLDTTPHFNSPVLQQINHTSSSTSTTDNQSVIINNMRYGSMYYWRVRAANYNGTNTSSWSATWQFHTMDFVNNTDNTINNSDSTQNYYTRQTLYWKNNRGSTKYLLQLDTTPHFNSPILREIYTTNDIDNTTNELSTKVYNMLYGTTYYYRVCAINNAPDTSGWSATWQFHTINKVFSTSNTLNDTTQTETYFTRISMKWENNRGSTQYILQLDTTPDFNSPVFRQVNITNDIDDDTNELSTTVYNLLHGAMYYYRICAINNAPDTSDWSNTWQFHTRDKVFLYSPENQTTNASLSTTLQWKNNKGSSKFILQVDTSTNFNSSSLREIIVASSITNNDSYKSNTLNDLRFGNTYYWRVRSVNEAPDTSGWSDVWSFTTTYQLTTGPVLISPPNDSTDIDFQTAITLQWDTLDNVNGYRYQVSTSSDFSTLFAQGTTAQTTASIHNLRPATTYYWRVQGYNGVGNSVWSAVWHFTTGGCPPIVTSFTHEICEGELPYHYINGDIDTTFEVGTPQLSTFNFQLSTPLGCDSIVTLHLTVHPTVTSTSSATVCESELPYHYVNGDIDITFEVGTPNLSVFNFQFSTEYGCDSTVILTVNIATATEGDTAATACGSFNWHGYTNLTESGDYTDVMENAAGCDSTVTLHLTINTPTEGDTTATACGSFSWHGYTNLTESGDYTDVIENAAGCDSTVTLHLTINVPTEGDTTATACGSFSWHSYTNLTESGDYTDVIENSAGCDSTVTLHLTINTPTESDTSATACGSFSWHGYTNLTESGDYTDVLENAAGCDSIVTLHLTVNQPVVTEPVEVTICENDLPYHYVNGAIDTTFEVGTPNLSTVTYNLTTGYGCDSTVTLTVNINQPVENETDVTACDEYEWNGEVLTTSGDYSVTFTAANGCDSVVTLHLTVNHPVENETDVTACDEYEWQGETLTASGDYTATFTAVNGCDSVVMLHLTVNQAVENETDVTACDEYEWNGEMLTESGDYTATFTAANGCDSVVTLHLTVNQAVTSTSSVTICENDLPYHYINGDIDTTFEVGTPNLSIFSFQFSTQYGCDSVVTLHLTINPCDTNGIDDNGIVDITLYPNPTTGMVNVQCTMYNEQCTTREW